MSDELVRELVDSLVALAKKKTAWNCNA